MIEATDNKIVISVYKIYYLMGKSALDPRVYDARYTDQGDQKRCFCGRKEERRNSIN